MDTIFVWLIVGVAAILATIVVAVFVIVATNLPDFSDFGSFGINDVHPPHRFLSFPRPWRQSEISARSAGT
jgi:hypothetical protein